MIFKKIYLFIVILIIIGVISLLLIFNPFNQNIPGGYINTDIDSNLFSEKLDFSSSLKIYWKETPVYVQDEYHNVTCNEKNVVFNKIEEDGLVYKYCGNYFTLTSKNINPTTGPMEFGPFYNGVISEDKCIGEMKDNCYFVLAMQNNNIDYCENIDFVSLKERCYYVSAEKNNDLSKCELIDGNWGQYQDPKYDCYSTLIVRNSNKENFNVNFCSQINYSRSKDKCYAHLAIVDRNIDVCNLIEESDRMQDCISSMLK